MASLPTPDIVLKVATGPSGVIEGKRVRRFVDLSTTGAVMAQRIFKLLARAQHRADRLPGERRRARRGKGHGRRDGVRAARGRRGGRAGAESDRQDFCSSASGRALGQTMKLVNNVLSAAAMAATAEAMVTGVKAGLDPRQMLEVINAGTGRNTATEDKFTKAILPAHVRSRLCRGPDAQGREAFPRRSAKRSACRPM